MDSTASLISLHFAAQEAPSMAEPLSAELLQYRLSRTPTSRRFNRNRAVVTPMALGTGSRHDQNTPSLESTESRPASEVTRQTPTAEEAPSSSIRIARRRPAPKLFSAPSQTTTDSTFAVLSRAQPSGSNRHAESLSETTASEYHEESSDHSIISSDDTNDLILNDAIREAAVLGQVNDTRKVQEQGVPPPHSEQRQTGTSLIHISEAQPSSDPAERRKLKRPAKRTPLPSAPPSIQQTTATKDGTSTRQYSIPDDERPVKAKKRTRARRLPVDELELAEERQTPYDAPPMSGPNEADSDPIEESTQRGARPLRKAKRKTDINQATETSKKSIPVRTKPQSQRADFFAGFKVIKRPVPSNTSQKRTLEHPIVGDGFEGLERLPTGRPVRSANKRRQTKPRLAPPTKCYRSLEIVEDKSFEQALQHGDDISGIKVEQIAYERPNDDHGSEHPALPACGPQNHPIDNSRYLPMTQEHHHVAVMADMAGPGATEEAGNETEETDNLDIPVVQGTVMQDQSPHDVRPTSSHEPIEERASLLQNAERPEEYLRTRTVESYEPVEKPVQALADWETSQKWPGSQIVETHQQTEEPAVTEDRPLPPAEDGEEPAPAIVEIQPKMPQVAYEVLHETKQPPKKVKRTVTFSEEVKVVADVEDEPEEEEEEEEMNSSDEQLSAESESGNESDQSQQSDADESADEDDEAAGSEEDIGNNEEDDDNDDYPRGNLRPRTGSPELVSSGYYDRSDTVRQPFSIVNQAGKELESFDDEDSIAPGEDNMMLDLDDEIEDMPEPPKSYAYETGKMAYFIDSDEEMLSVTSRATSLTRQSSSNDDKIEPVQLPPLKERGRRTDRGGKARTLRDASIPDSEPDHLFEGDCLGSAAGVYDMRDDELPSTRDENFEELSKGSGDEMHPNAHRMSFSDSASHLPQPSLVVSTPFSGAKPPLRREHSGVPELAVHHNFRITASNNTALAFSTAVVPQEQHYGAPRVGPPPSVSRKIRRAKTGLAHVRPSQQSSPVQHNTVVMDAPSYFTQASQRLSSPLKDAVVMMRRAKTLPSTQYVSESGDEDGFTVMSDETWRERLSGRKRHLSLSDSVESGANMDFKDLVKRSNEEVGRSMEVKRKKSLPFKSPSRVAELRYG